MKNFDMSAAVKFWDKMNWKLYKRIIELKNEND